MFKKTTQAKRIRKPITCRRLAVVFSLAPVRLLYLRRFSNILSLLPSLPIHTYTSCRSVVTLLPLACESIDSTCVRVCIRNAHTNSHELLARFAAARNAYILNKCDGRKCVLYAHARVSVCDTHTGKVAKRFFRLFPPFFFLPFTPQCSIPFSRRPSSHTCI